MSPHAESDAVTPTAAQDPATGPDPAAVAASHPGASAGPTPRAGAPGGPDLVALRRELERMSAHPSIGRIRETVFRVHRALDFVGHLKNNVARFLARVNPYPKPWRHVTFRTQDGVQIAAWLGPQHRTSPSPWGLVLVPGMFASKDDTVHKRQAIHIHRHWRIPVIAIDMRAFGESTGIATAGWKEALDVHAAARFLVAETGVKRVAVLSESLGGAAALNALAHDSQSGADLLGGGVLCFSAFVDARDAVQHISEKPPRGHAFNNAYAGFRKLLLLKSGGAYERFDDLLEDTAQVNGLRDVNELYDLANPKWKVPMMKQPVLLVHAIDDPIVPVRHARRMERYAEGKPNIQTLITTWGGHTQFEMLDAHWFWEVARRWFGAVNGVELENLAGK